MQTLFGIDWQHCARSQGDHGGAYLTQGGKKADRAHIAVGRPLHWVVGGRVRTTRRFPACLFSPCELASPHTLPSATTLLHPSRRELPGCHPRRPTALL